MTLEEMMKAVLMSAQAETDGEVTVAHEAVPTYEVDGVTVTVHANIQTHALEKIVVEDSDGEQIALEGDDVHSFITVMARVLKGMSTKPL